MYKKYLGSLCKLVFNYDIDIQSKVNIIFLFQQLGIKIRNYKFSLSKRGLTSIELLEDIENGQGNKEKEITFSNDVLNVAKRIKDLLNIEKENIEDWLNILSIIFYMRKYVLSSSCTKDEVLQYYENRYGEHKHLENAYEIVNKLLQI